jgi:hypothetical protein
VDFRPRSMRESSMLLPEPWWARERRLYASHRSRIAGFHGKAKTWHGLARAVRRGFENMKILAYLTATSSGWRLPFCSPSSLSSLVAGEIGRAPSL